MNAPGPVCVYDGDCPFCRAAVALGRRLDRRGELTWIASQDHAALRAAGVPEDPRAAETVLVWEGDGTPAHTESAAVAAVLRRAPLVGPPLAALIRLARPLADRVYRRVSANRYRLARLPLVRRR